jgi:hypothetical protein
MNSSNSNNGNSVPITGKKSGEEKKGEKKKKTDPVLK